MWFVNSFHVYSATHICINTYKNGSIKEKTNRKAMVKALLNFIDVKGVVSNG